MNTRPDEVAGRRGRQVLRGQQLRAGTTHVVDTLHPAPSTLRPAPCTLHPTPYTLHPEPYILDPTP